MAQHSDPYQLDDEITITEFLVQVKRWINRFGQYWKTGVFVGLLTFGAIMAWRFAKDTVYRAELTLILSDDTGQQFGGLSSILGQVGLPISGGKYNIDKLIEIAKSRRIIDQTLLQRVSIGGQEKLLASHFINILELDKAWQAEWPEATASLSEVADTSAFYRFAMKKLNDILVGGDRAGASFQPDYGRDHYIMSFTIEVPDEALGIAFLNTHYETLKSFYIQTAKAKQQQTFDIISAKRDSMLVALQKVERQLAILEDHSLANFQRQDNIRLAELRTSSLILKTAYAKLEENLALAEFTLENTNPIIQIIDRPTPPLEKLRPSLLKCTLLAILLAICSVWAHSFWHFWRQLEA